VLRAPFIDLSNRLDLGDLDEVHDEVCLGLSSVSPTFTGGSHRSMGITPSRYDEGAWVDYGEVLAKMSDEDHRRFVGLSDDPAASAPRGSFEFGEERDVPLSRRQMLWLKYRFGVYFPWQIYVELMPNDRWENKANPEGKEFTRLARTLFPKTIALVRRLPFTCIGRCNLMGLDPHQFGTTHRDGDPDAAPPHFITLCPAPGKRLFLWDDEARMKTFVTGRAYWFNEGDYHGVEADPFFRYSIRVDGVFTDAFLASLARD